MRMQAGAQQGAAKIQSFVDGHFGAPEPGLPWEAFDQSKPLECSMHPLDRVSQFIDLAVLDRKGEEDGRALLVVKMVSL